MANLQDRATAAATAKITEAETLFTKLTSRRNLAIALGLAVVIAVIAILR